MSATAYEQLREQHLDLWNVDKVLLTGASTYGASILPDPDFAADTVPRLQRLDDRAVARRRTTGC